MHPTLKVLTSFEIWIGFDNVQCVMYVYNEKLHAYQERFLAPLVLSRWNLVACFLLEISGGSGGGGDGEGQKGEGGGGTFP